jgi:glycosyl transferase family 25
MRVVVINLDRSPDRLAMFREQAERLGIAFERLSAVEGSTIQVKRGPLTPSEIACFESHRLAWKSLVDSGEPWLAVFEDDIILAPAIAEFLSNPKRFPTNADLIKLETSSSKIVISRRGVRFRSYSLHRMLSIHWGSAGYIVSRRAAIRLLERTTNYRLSVDDVIFDPVGADTWDIRILQAVPALCIQEQALAQVEKRPLLLESLIEHSWGAVVVPPPKPVQGKISREVRRVVRQVVDFTCKPFKYSLVVPFIEV